MSLGSGRAPETDRDDEGLCDDFSGWGIEPNEGEADDRPPRARYDGRGEAEERNEQVVEVTTRKDEAGEGDNMRRFHGVWALSPPKSDFRSQTPRHLHEPVQVAMSFSRLCFYRLCGTE